MNINILVTGGLHDSSASYSALRFCRAAVAQGHNMTQVFFYQAGVTVGNALAEPLADEFNATAEWLALAEQHEIPLVVCVAAAERRGVINQQQQQELGKDAANLHSRFEVAGLASFYAACQNADRLVSFK